MVSTAEGPIDVVDFQFKELCRLKAFDSDNSFPDVCNLVAVASRFGLIFIATKSNEFQVIQVKDIEDCSKDVSNYKRRIVALPSRSLHISVNCDCTKLAVVISKDNCPHVVFYDVLSFLKQNILIINHTRLSPSPNCKILSIDWNPTLPDVFTACKNDGTLLLYEFKGSPLELPSAAGATCFCWSPKGKQLAVGSRDGKITQYKIDLKAVKVTEAPPGFTSISSLFWVSSFQFFGIYDDAAGEQTSLICVDAPKTGPTLYTTFDDVCYSNGSARPQYFYLMHQQHWNILVVASSNSMEIGILGMDQAGKWTQWMLNDNSRAALPLGVKYEDTLPIGAVFNVGSMKCQIGNDIKQAPSLLVLSDHGFLCIFQAINSRPGAMDICQLLENVADRSGESLFAVPQSAPTSTIQPVSNIPPAAPTNNQTVQIPKTVATFSSLPMAPRLSMNSVPPTITPISNKPLENHETKPQQSVFGLPALNINNKQPQPKPPSSIFNQTPIQKPIFNPIAPTPVQELKTPPPTYAPAQPKPVDKLPINEETETMIAQLVREECLSLENELHDILKGANTQMQIGTDSEMSQMARKALELEEFYYAIKENINTHDSEVYGLKQNLLQTWSCYEEACTRFASSKDPVTKILMQSMPLDPASQNQVDEISRMMYYIESQLTQANQCLDEQWDAFQDVLMKSSKLKMPTMETVYQSMVQHNKVLQKQKYILKHIASRIKSVKRVQCNTLLNLGNATNETFVNLEEELSKLQIHSMPQQYNRLIERQSKLNAQKTKKMYDMFMHRGVSMISSSKPVLNNSTVQLSTLLAAPLSPIGKKLGNKFDHKLINSTPKPLQELKMQKVPTQAYTPTTQQYGIPATVQKPTTTIPSNLFGSSAFGGGAKLQLQAQNRPMAVSSSIPKMIPVPGPGNTSPVVKPVPVATVASNVFGFDMTTSSSTGATGIFGGVGTASSTTITSSNPSITTLFRASPFSASQGTIASTMGKSAFSFSSAPGTPFGQFAPSTSASVFGFPTNATITPATTQTKVTVTTSAICVPKPALLATPVTSIVSTQPLQSPVISKPTILGSSSGKPAFSVVPSIASIVTTVPSVTSSISSASGIFAGAANTFSASGGFFGTISTAATSTTTISSSQSLFSNTNVTSSSVETTKSIFSTGLSPSTNIFSAKPTSSTTSIFASKPSIFGGSTTTLTALTATKSIFGIASSTESTPIPSGIFGGSTTGGIPKTTATLSQESTITIATSTKETCDTTTSTTTLGGHTVTLVDTPQSEAVMTTSGATTIAAATSTITSAITSSTPGLDSSVPATTVPVAFGTLKPAVTTSTVSAPATPPAFGSTVNTTTTDTTLDTSIATSMTAATTAAITTGSIFANAAFGTSSSKSIFAGAPTAASTTASIFGATSTPFASSTAFGTFSPFAAAVAPTTFGQASTTSSPFVQAATNTTVFAQPPTTTTAPFVQSPATSAPFGETATSDTPFAQSQATTTPFGLAPTTTSFGQTPATTAVFAQTPAHSASFGQTPVTSTTPFGQAPAATTKPFGQAPAATTKPFGQAPATTTPFGQATTTSLFGQTTTSPFGQTVPTTAPFVSGTTTSSSATFSGGSLFGQPSKFTQGSVFGGGTATTTGSSIFGGQAATAPTSNSPFATSAFGSSPFASTTSASPTPAFGNNNFSGSTFGSQNTTAFASPPNTSSNTFNLFGGLSVGGSTSSPFVQSTPAANPFGRAPEQKSSFVDTSSNLFTSPASPAQNTFGGGNTSFGGNTFGQQNTFGNSSFGAGSPTPGAFSGTGGQSVQQSGFGSPNFQKPAFGSAPVFGQPAFGGNASFGAAPTFGGGATFGSPQKVFGGGAESPSPGFGAAANVQSSNFGSIASQNTVGFGNLAQQASQSQPLQFSGGSSFTNWRN